MDAAKLRSKAAVATSVTVATAAQTDPVRRQTASSRIASTADCSAACDSAGVGQVLEPWSDGDADHPENPVERRADRAYPPTCVAGPSSGRLLKGPCTISQSRI